jgi:hypothetical protein
MGESKATAVARAEPRARPAAGAWARAEAEADIGNGMKRAPSLHQAPLDQVYLCFFALAAASDK